MHFGVRNFSISVLKALAATVFLEYDDIIAMPPIPGKNRREFRRRVPLDRASNTVSIVGLAFPQRINPELVEDVLAVGDLAIQLRASRGLITRKTYVPDIPGFGAVEILTLVSLLPRNSRFG